MFMIGATPSPRARLRSIFIHSIAPIHSSPVQTNVLTTPISALSQVGSRSVSKTDADNLTDNYDLGSQCYCGDALLTTSTESGATCFGTSTYKCPANTLELCGGDTGMPVYGFISSIGTCPAGTSIYSTPGGTTQACQTITGRK